MNLAWGVPIVGCLPYLVNTEDHKKVPLQKQTVAEEGAVTFNTVAKLQWRNWIPGGGGRIGITRGTKLNPHISLRPTHLSPLPIYILHPLILCAPVTLVRFKSTSSPW